MDWKFEGGQFNLNSLVDSPAYYYYNRTSSDNTYGLLYNWYSLKYLNDNKDILIPGWRAPTYNDVITLYNFISTLVPTMLKSKSTWRTGYNGIDMYEFGLLAAGAINDNGFVDRGDYGGFFTLNETSSEQAYNTYCYYHDNSMSTSSWYKRTARSLRLIKDT